MIDVNVQILYMFGNVVCTPKKGPKLLRFFWNSKCFAGQDFLVTLFSWLFLVEDFKVTLFSLSDPNLSLPLNCESRGLVVSKKGRQVVSANTRRMNSHTYFATRSLEVSGPCFQVGGPSGLLTLSIAPFERSGPTQMKFPKYQRIPNFSVIIKSGSYQPDILL